MVGEKVYHVADILREFLDHNFVSGFRTLKPKNLKNEKPTNLKLFPSKTSFFPALR